MKNVENGVLNKALMKSAAQGDIEEVKKLVLIYILGIITAILHFLVQQVTDI